MTRHGNSEIHVELKVLFHLLVHLERVIGSAVKVFSQVVLSSTRVTKNPHQHEEQDDEPDDCRQNATSS